MTRPHGRRRAPVRAVLLQARGALVIPKEVGVSSWRDGWRPCVLREGASRPHQDEAHFHAVSTPSGCHLQCPHVRRVPLRTRLEAPPRCVGRGDLRHSPPTILRLDLRAMTRRLYHSGCTLQCCASLTRQTAAPAGGGSAGRCGDCGEDKDHARVNTCEAPGAQRRVRFGTSSSPRGPATSTPPEEATQH